MLWTAQIEGGPVTFKQAAVAVKEKIFQFGNQHFDDWSSPLLDVFVLHTSSNRWETLPKPSEESNYCWPPKRHDHTVAAEGEKVFLFGGFQMEGGYCSDLYIFDTTSLEWSKPSVNGETPTSRRGHTATIVGQSMYVLGGSKMCEQISGVHRLDLKTLTWSLLGCQGDEPNFSGSHSVTAIGDRMYIFGGKVSSYPFSSRLYYLDTTTNTWHTTPPPPPSAALTNSGQQQTVPEGRGAHSALNVGGKLLIFGGINADKYLDDLWLFDPATWTWSPVKPLGRGPCPRARQAMCKVGNRIYIFGGRGGTEGQQDLAGLLQEIALFRFLFVLDLSPTLRTLCLRHVIDNGKETRDLPRGLRSEIRFMTEPNAHFDGSKRL